MLWCFWCLSLALKQETNTVCVNTYLIFVSWCTTFSFYSLSTVLIYYAEVAQAQASNSCSAEKLYCKQDPWPCHHGLRSLPTWVEHRHRWQKDSKGLCFTHYQNRRPSSMPTKSCHWACCPPKWKNQPCKSSTGPYGPEKRPLNQDLHRALPAQKDKKNYNRAFKPI